MFRGLETALEIFRRNARGGALPSLLLLTDGVPNVEPSGGHLGALEAYRLRTGGSLPCTAPWVGVFWGSWMVFWGRR